jgi:serine/threonine protein kinase
VVNGVELAVMELCGCSLERLLRQLLVVQSEMEESGYLTLRRLLKWCLLVAQVSCLFCKVSFFSSRRAQGVAVLHDKNIIHRDLAPRNILIGPNAKVAVDRWLNNPCDPQLLISQDDLDLVSWVALCISVAHSFFLTSFHTQIYIYISTLTHSHTHIHRTLHL